MADPVLLELASGQNLVAYPVTLAKADGTTITALVTANMLVSTAGGDILGQMLAQQATMITLLEQLVANGGGTAPVEPTLEALTLAVSTVALGTAASLHLTGTTDGSTLTATPAIAGITFDPTEGNFDYDGTGALGVYPVSITEAKGGATRTTQLSITIAPAGTFIPSLDFSDARNSQNL